jgi:hypothetical protein
MLRVPKNRALLAVVTIAMALGSPLLAAETSINLPTRPNLDTGYRQMYNLDFSGAHSTFHEYQRSAPDDPMGYVSDAAAYLFSEFDRLHVLESDLFVNDSHFENRSRLAADPRTKAAFDEHLAKADELSAKALAKDPGNINALFAQVMGNGLRADYTALIEKRNLASLSYIKASRGLAQQLLAVHPNCYDAYLSLGAENYLLGVNAAPVRWVLRLSGAQTDKQEGIKQLQIVAEKGHYLAPFARLLLAVAALRDKDVPTARSLLSGLANEFPQNQLYEKELARLP